MARRLTRTMTAAFLLSASLLAGAAGPAVAAPPPNPCKKTEQGKPPYPPGQCKKGSVSNPDAHPGEQQIAFSGDGEFDPGSTVRGENHSKAQDLGTTKADALGGATFNFTIPQDAENGSHEVVFIGTLDGAAHQTSVKYKVSRNKVGTKSFDTNSTGTVTGQPPAQAPGAAGAPAAPDAAPDASGAGQGTPSRPRSSAGVLHLPRTGTAIISTGAAGAGALLIGAGLLLLGRRRRDEAIAEALPG